MEISSQGVKSSTLEEKLKEWTLKLKAKYGNDFFIKKEGVIDNLATGVSAVSLDYESILLYLIKNMNPYTAEDEWQDFLYSLIGLQREQATFTIVQRTVQGAANSTITKGSLVFENTGTQDQYTLLNDLTLNESGVGVGTFQAVERGAIGIEDDTICKIVSAPAAVTGVYFAEGNIAKIGVDYESDAEFRERWLQEQSLVVTSTEGGIKKALLPYCGNQASNVQIRMNRAAQDYTDVPLHSANIVVYSAYDDETIANVIFNKAIDGLGLAGNISVKVLDSEGNEEDILFSRAEEKPVQFKVVLSLEDGYTFSASLSTSVKDAIKNNLKLNMGDSVIANKTVKFIDEVEGVDYVKSVQVSLNGSTWSDLVEISKIQIATIGEINVSV